jgi:ABC-2 type transport system permease protein
VPDGGSAAYYTFHIAANAPSSLAFAALGQRDIAPYVMRIRALALEGQLHGTGSTNPELTRAGRFDLAFVLVYLAPLVLFVLLHDLVSGEREAGRWMLLEAAPGSRSLWLLRVTVRALAVVAVIAMPLLAGTWASGASLGQVASALGIVAATVGFWTAVSLLLSRRESASGTNAARLAAAWFALTLVAPGAAQLAVNALVPVPQGADLLRLNREAVHSGWDLPKDATMSRFFVSHPQWSRTPPVTRPFHWKWYFAFQHLGDEEVSALAGAYRDGVARREALARRVGWLIPPVGLQQALHRVARTDVSAQLAFQDEVRGFHAELRHFYYPFIFNEIPFSEHDFARAPRFGSTSLAGDRSAP